MCMEKHLQWYSIVEWEFTIVNEINVISEFQKDDDFLKDVDLQKLFSETCENASSNKRSSGVLDKDESSKNGKKIKNENNENSGISSTVDDGLDPISENDLSEDESTIINGFLLVDEVGTVDIDDFNDIFSRIVEWN